MLDNYDIISSHENEIRVNSIWSTTIIATDYQYLRGQGESVSSKYKCPLRLFSSQWSLLHSHTNEPTKCTQ